MNRRGPFTPEDLAHLGEFYEETAGVVSMREIHAGNRDPRVVGVRHDVDGNKGSVEAAVAFARWEAERGYRSTYFLLHTAPYWTNGELMPMADSIAEGGHEIGIHADALAEALVHGGDPHELLHEALEVLRGAGFEVVGTVAHGNQVAYAVPSDTGMHYGFSNDEQFLECIRPNLGAPDREIRLNGRTLKLDPKPLSHFGLEYESINLRQIREAGIIRTRAHQLYNTDSGCKWFHPFQETIDDFRLLTDGQLHLNIHPDWWPHAFVSQEVAA